jgi:hypothetical protein
MYIVGASGRYHELFEVEVQGGRLRVPGLTTVELIRAPMVPGVIWRPSVKATSLGYTRLRELFL